MKSILLITRVLLEMTQLGEILRVESIQCQPFKGLRDLGTSRGPDWALARDSGKGPIYSVVPYYIFRK